MIERRHNFVVISVDEKERRRIGGRRNVIRSAGIDRRGKIGAAVRIMMQGDGSGDVTASREAKYSDSILGKAPFRGAGAHEARARTRRTACWPSAIASGITVFRRSAIFAGSFASVSPVRITRYLRMNAATPMEFSQCARSAPSWDTQSSRKPPPGQIITAVPVAREGSGK